MANKTLDTIFKYDLSFIKNMIETTGNDIAPQISVWKGDKTNVMVLVGLPRKAIIKIIEGIKRVQPDFISMMVSGYAKKIPKEDSKEELEKFEHGMLEKEFQAGSKSVVENVILQVWSKDKKKIAMITREGKKILNIEYPNPDDFEGAMML